MEVLEDVMEMAFALVDRVVARRLGDLVVTPREVDERVTRMADLLALGINRALQPRLIV